MAIKIQKICSRIITYSFYLLFALVPIIFTPFNFELFEFNKMWVTYGLTILIVASWLSKMILAGEVRIQRTPLDLPLLLFLLANVLSTIFSIDVHTSIWGYYSRFNAGLLSIIAYILLYYAFVSNYTSEKTMVMRLLLLSLATGALVAFYGILEHFGIDKDLWIQDVQNRVFSTLGQPNWLAAYLAILIPIALAFAIENSKHEARNSKPQINFRIFKFSDLNLFRISIFGFSALLFYLALLYTKSRSGFLGLWVALLFFLGVYFWDKQETLRNITLKKFVFIHRYILIVLVGLIAVTFLIGTPFEQSPIPSTLNPIPHGGPALEAGGTESGEIRKIVWRGAIEIARQNPLFGSGVETFAYAYYKVKPLEHNLTSEWDFLYNKAHNEYLNYLATTGIFGLGSYLLMIGVFLFHAFKFLNSKLEYRNSKQSQNTNNKNIKHFDHSNLGDLNLFRASDFGFRILIIALVAGYISILVSNFFGFSVVIINLYFFLIPAFVFVLILPAGRQGGLIDPQKVFVFPLGKSKFSIQWISILGIILIAYYLLLNLSLFWLADKDYATGYNLDRAGQFEKSYQYLSAAVKKRNDEPTFRDELAINSASLAAAFEAQGDATSASQLAQQAIALSQEVTAKHPNNVSFLKNKARVFYALSVIDEKYLQEAIFSLERARLLAPVDPKIAYNLALLYSQLNQFEPTIKILQETIKLKPNFRDAYYALGLFYYNDTGKRQEAINQMDYIIKNIASDDSEATEKLLEWRGY